MAVSIGEPIDALLKLEPVQVRRQVGLELNIGKLYCSMPLDDKNQTAVIGHVAEMNQVVQKHH
jgi:hypothetical protein